MKKVVYCGVPGSYAEEAAIKYFESDAELLTANSFSDAFESIKKGVADFAVVPIENSSTGAISAVYDLLGSYGFYIVGECHIAISHCLLAKKGVELDDIIDVFSHEQGLFQSRDFLQEYNWQQNVVYNTAAAAKLVSESDKPFAAVASKRSAEIYGLEILKEKINYKEQNQTRFVVVSENAMHSEENNKVSLAFSLPHVSGSLYNILGIFSREKLNLVKIESRPIADKNWEYIFFLDFTAETVDDRISEILEELKKETENLKILGYYKNAMGV